MPRQTTAEEESTRNRMKKVYAAEKMDPNGWNDWGMFTAHVVHGFVQEVTELRKMLKENGVDPGPERDPFE